MAATTFAADTPLAVTGLIAAKGLSGNWLWLPVLGMHAAVFVFFAASWSRTGVLTDAEFVWVRYSGTPAVVLRWCRASLQLLTNCVVLGWVLRAMVKIASPFFLWEQWLPGLMRWIEPVWPTGTALGSPSEGLTIIVLLLVVGCYSSLGGLRGVVLTDLVQLCLSLCGSIWLGLAAWQAVGGRAGLLDGLVLHYGSAHHYLDLFPTPGSGWLGAVGIGTFVFGLYVLVQSYATMSSDGGGYFMQRLNATKHPRDAQKAALLFLVIHYLVRVWPWFVVGLAALVLIPLGQEVTALDGAAAIVQDDREMAWPVLMAYLLRPGMLGLVLVSLLAAFMSTVDTHINWGASYIVNDVWLVLRPAASNREQIRVARTAVLLFVVVAIVVSAKIDTIAHAWTWVALLGASLGLPTVLRWVWWRVNAAGELGAMLCGLGAGVLLAVCTDLPYEVRLIWVSAASLLGLLGGIVFGPATDPACVRHFVSTVAPLGCWPHHPHSTSEHRWASLTAVMRWAAVVAGTLLLLLAGYRLLFVGQWLFALLAGIVALSILWIGVRISSAVPVRSGG
jgi:Na+/proline symporter